MAKRREASGAAPKKGAKMPKPPKTGGRSVGRRGGR
jgi:hypothetical protein